MVRTSSPGVYSRTAANSMPRPLNTAWYEPTIPDSRIERVRIRIRRTFWSISRSSIRSPSLRDLHPLQHAIHDVLGGDVLRLRLVGQQDAVAQHVVGDLLHVLRHHIAAAAQERERPGRLGKGQGGAGGGAECDRMRDVGEARLPRAAGRDDEPDDVVPDALVEVDLAYTVREPPDGVPFEHPRD